MAVLTSAQVITFETHAVRLHDGLKALGSAVGQRLQCHDSLADDWLVLKVDDAPVEETLAMVADAMQARWQPAREGRQLVPDPSKDSSAKAWQKAVRKFLASAEASRPRSSESEHRKDIEAQIAFNQRPEGAPWDSEEYNRLLRLGPGSRAATRMMAALGEAELLAAPGRKRVVYAVEPTVAQRPLPARALAAWREFVAELPAYNRLAEEYEARAAGSERRYVFPNRLPEPRPDAAPYLVLTTKFGTCQANVGVGGADGGHRGQHTASFSIWGEPEPADGATDAFAGVGGLMELSEHAQWQLTTFADRPPGSPAPPPSPYTDLLKHEPMHGLPSELVLALAKATGKNFAARLDDGALFYGTVLPDPAQPDLEALASGLASRCIVATPNERWIVATARRDWPTEDYELDRKGVNQLLKTPLNGPGYVDAIASVATAASSEFSFQFTVSIAEIFQSGRPGTGNLSPFWALQAYGSLGAAERRMARGKDGYAAQYGSLPEQARKVVAQALHSVPVWMRRADDAMAQDPRRWPDFDEFGEPGPSTFDDEPTTLFPLGLPPTARVVFLLEEKDGYLAQEGLPFDSAGRAVTPESEAYRAFFQEKAPQQGPQYGPRERRYFTGKRRRLLCLIDVGGKLMHRASIPFNDRPEEGKTWTLAEAPEEFRKAYEAALAKAREEYKDWAPRSKTPPPH